MAIFLGVLLTIAASLTSAEAEVVCKFDKVCLEGQTCNVTNLSVRRTVGQRDMASLRTWGGTFYGYRLPTAENAHFLFMSETDGHFLTEYDDGTARYTVHMNTSEAVTYFGKCGDGD